MKKIILIGTIIFTVFLWLGCGNSSMTDIYDDKTAILSDSNSYNLDENEQNIENQNFAATLEQFEGMDTIWTYEADQDAEIDLNYQMTVTSGNAKLVLISPDDTLTTLIDTKNQDKNVEYSVKTFLTVKKGQNRIKLVADKDTKLDIKITIPSGDFHEVGM